MKSDWLMKSAAAISLTMMLASSCATNSQRLTLAATTQGKIDAGIHLPAIVPDCRLQEPHAALAAGAEVRSVLIRERDALDRANSRVTRCADSYDDIRSKFAAE